MHGPSDQAMMDQIASVLRHRNVSYIAPTRTRPDATWATNHWSLGDVHAKLSDDQLNLTIEAPGLSVTHVHGQPEPVYRQGDSDTLKAVYNKVFNVRQPGRSTYKIR